MTGGHTHGQSMDPINGKTTLAPGRADGNTAEGNTPKTDGPYLDLAYSYDGTLEGLFSAVFAAYEQREDPKDVCPDERIQPRLGQYVRYIPTDYEHVTRVVRGIMGTCGEDTFDFVKKAALCDDYEAGTDVYRFIRFAMKKGPSAMNALAHPLVSPLAKRNKFIWNESERMRQFVRFRELEGGIYFSRITPKAQVLPLVMDGFMARFNTQPFIIFDEVHHLAGVFEGTQAKRCRNSIWGACSWYLVPVDPASPLALPPEAHQEHTMQQAWKSFYRATTIATRYNPELRQHFMPRRFWENLTELQEDFTTRRDAKHPVSQRQV